MGAVTFNGNTATPESQVYIREKEMEIYNGPGDSFVKARKIEMLYRDNGLEPGTFQRAGTANQIYEGLDDMPRNYSPIKGLVNQALRCAGALFLVAVSVVMMSCMGT